MTGKRFFLSAKTIAGAAMAAVAIALVSPAASADPAPTYHVVNKFAVGGDGGWDYISVNGRLHRLYVTRGNRVSVINETDGTLVGEITNLQGIHGTAIDYQDNKGFISAGGENNVVVFALDTLKEIERIPVGTRPDCIIYDRSSDRVFAMNGGSNNVSAIDGATDKVLGTIPLDGRPEYAVSDGQGHIYVNIEDKSEISQIDANKLTVLNTWSIAPGDGPSGLAMDRKNRRLFSVCDNQMMVVLDADTGKVIATPAIGNGPDAAAFNPQKNFAYSSNGRDGTITIVQEVDPNTFKVVQTATTQLTARTMALDAETDMIYLPAATVAPPAPGAPPQQGYRRNFVPGSFTLLVVGE